MKVFRVCMILLPRLLLLIVNAHTSSSWRLPDTVTPAIVEGNLHPIETNNKNNDSFFCPDKCVCSLQERIIDCSSLELSSVPRVPRETSRLYLHSNRIESLQPHAFKDLQQLTYLILSGNDITQLQGDTFMRLTSLKYLILDNNNISSLPSELFQSLLQLETISLARNELEVLTGGLFTHNNLVTLLNLQGNKLHTLETGAFAGLSQLATLNLDDNLLDKHVFEELRKLNNLTTLRLNGNTIASLPVLGIVLPHLKYISLQSNLITGLTSPFMVQCSSLETLILNQNRIQRVSAGVFASCANLTKLELRENAIESLSVDIFLGLKSLKYLYLHKNSISQLSPSVFNGLQSIQAIYLCYNKLSWIPGNVFTGLKTISTIHLEWNELTSLVLNSFVDLPSLETIYLHHNSIREIEPGSFVNLQKLKNLDLYSNQITFVKPGVLNVLHSLQKIQIDPLVCSCSLLHLTSWSKRHHIRGLTCRSDKDNKVYSILNLDKSCMGSKSNTDSYKILSPPKPSGIMQSRLPKENPEVRGPQKTKRKIMATRRKDTLTMAVPKGPSLHKTSTEKVLLKLDEIQHSVIQLQFRMLHVESILDKGINPRKKRVCLYDRTRLEVGDQWMDGDKECICNEFGTVQCLPLAGP